MEWVGGRIAWVVFVASKKCNTWEKVGKCLRPRSRPLYTPLEIDTFKYEDLVPVFALLDDQTSLPKFHWPHEFYDFADACWWQVSHELVFNDSLMDDSPRTEKQTEHASPRATWTCLHVYSFNAKSYNLRSYNLRPHPTATHYLKRTIALIIIPRASYKSKTKSKYS